MLNCMAIHYETCTYLHANLHLRIKEHCSLGWFFPEKKPSKQWRAERTRNSSQISYPVRESNSGHRPEISLFGHRCFPGWNVFIDVPLLSYQWFLLIFVALEPRTLTRFEVYKYAREAFDLGVRYIGGCCGFEAYHIRAIAEEVSSMSPWKYIVDKMDRLYCLTAFYTLSTKICLYQFQKSKNPCFYQICILAWTFPGWKTKQNKDQSRAEQSSTAKHSTAPHWTETYRYISSNSIYLQELVLFAATRLMFSATWYTCSCDCSLWAIAVLPRLKWIFLWRLELPKKIPSFCTICWGLLLQNQVIQFTFSSQS